MKKTFIFLLSFISLAIYGQKRNSDVYELTEVVQCYTRNEINLPDVNGYKTLKCDFHTHTIFSDGEVWPTVRIDEAWIDGLDAIAITDHIEYRPLKDIVVGDLNKSYEIAKEYADKIGFVVIKGTEITRKKPLGHLNALFIQDAEKMKVDDPIESINEAVRQGAFIMWNHPGWPNDTSTLYPIHRQLIEENKINGVEIGNCTEYYPKVIDWSKEFNLSPMSNSDIHSGVDELYGKGHNVRPLTLVFASDCSEQAIKEALFAHRTLAYFGGNLAGDKYWLESLLHSSLVAKVIVNHSEKPTYEITNHSDIDFKMTSNGLLYIFPANKTVRCKIKNGSSFRVLNCYVGDGKELEFVLID